MVSATPPLGQGDVAPALCNVPLKFVALSCLVLQTTSAVILTRYSKLVVDPRLNHPYLNTSLVCSAEFTKLVLSLLLMLLIDSRASVERELSVLRQQQQLEEGGSPGAGEKGGAFYQRLKIMLTHWLRSIYDENFATPLETLKLAVPAMLYTLQNNLVYVALDNLEATTFQVGYQMKIITTAVLSVMILGRHLSPLKWIALILLTLGIVMTQMDSGKDGSSSSSDDKEQDFSLGLISVITCGFSSALAGVYFEKILKGTSPSVWARNAQLAFFSTVLAFGATLYFEGIIGGLSKYFQGYNFLVILIIMVQALGGLIVAVVVKYADNILKGFASAISIVLCGFLSAALFGFSPSFMFIFGSCVVIVATVMYSTPDKPRSGFSEERASATVVKAPV